MKFEFYKGWVSPLLKVLNTTMGRRFTNTINTITTASVLISAGSHS